jgi:hypothetical protein
MMSVVHAFVNISVNDNIISACNYVRLLVTFIAHRFVDIAATHYNHISVGLTQLGCIYMWGQCRGQSITLPMETRFQSMHDVFACFGTPPVTWKPLDVGECFFFRAICDMKLVIVLTYSTIIEEGWFT